MATQNIFWAFVLCADPVSSGSQLAEVSLVVFSSTQPPAQHAAAHRFIFLVLSAYGQTDGPTLGRSQRTRPTGAARLAVCWGRGSSTAAQALSKGRSPHMGLWPSMGKSAKEGREEEVEISDVVNCSL